MFGCRLEAEGPHNVPSQCLWSLELLGAGPLTLWHMWGHTGCGLMRTNYFPPSFYFQKSREMLK